MLATADGRRWSQQLLTRFATPGPPRAGEGEGEEASE